MNRLIVATTLLAGAVPRPAAAVPQIVEREVRIGDRVVRALCTPGPLEALLLHGDSADVEAWRPVLERLDGVLGACAYDRTGLAGPDPRGWFELMDDMRRVHAALGSRRSYTLVGHDIGGLYARLYAAERPSDVGGLVLVEPAHEDMPEAAEPGMPRAAWEDWMRRRDTPNADGVRETELATRARGIRLRNMPVTVITATERPDGDGWDERFLNKAARRVHASILDGITLGRHVPAARSGHDVHIDAPDLVAREISRVVRQSRG